MIPSKSAPSVSKSTAVGTIGTSKTINSGDFDGTMMAAIKALTVENTAMKNENAMIKAEHAAIKKRLADLEVKDKALKWRLARTEQALGEEQPAVVPTRFEAK